MKIGLIKFNNRPDNLGDVIIYEFLARILIENNFKVYVTGVPLRSISNTVNIKNKWLYNLIIIKNIILQNNTYVFTSPGGPVFLNTQNKNLGYFLSKVYKIFGVKFIFSFSSITSKISNNQLKFNLNQFDYLLIRDSGSSELVKTIQLEKKIIHCSDITMHFMDRTKRNYSKNREFKFGISFRESTPEENHEDNFTLTQLNTILKSDSVLKFAQVVEDWNYLNNLFGECTFLTPENWIETYEKIEVVLTNRVHVFLFALLNGCNPVFITHHNHAKAINLIKDLGLDSRLIYYTEDLFEEKLNGICQEEEDLKQLVLDRINKMEGITSIINRL